MQLVFDYWQRSELRELPSKNSFQRLNNRPLCGLGFEIPQPKREQASSLSKKTKQNKTTSH